MADDSINIGVGIDPSESVASIDELHSNIGILKNDVEALAEQEANLAQEQENLNKAAAEFGEAVGNGFRQLADELDLFDDKTKLVGNTLADLASGNFVGFINDAIKIGTSLWNEQKEAIDSATGSAKQYNTALEDATATLEKNKKNKGKDSAFEGGDDQAKQDATRELGMQDLGFAKKGTWTRWFEDIGAKATDIVGGDDTGANADAAGGKKRQEAAQMAANNEKEKERRRLAQEAADGDMEQIRLDDEAREKQRLIDTKKREKERESQKKAAEEIAKMTMDELDKQWGDADKQETTATKSRDKSEEAFSRQQAMRDIQKQAKETAYTVQSGYDSAYNSIAKGASNTGKTAEQIEKESNELKQKWHEEDIAKLNLLIEAAQQTKSGLGAP